MEGREFSTDSLASMGDAKSPLKASAGSPHIAVTQMSIDSQVQPRNWAPGKVAVSSIGARGSARPAVDDATPLHCTNASLAEHSEQVSVGKESEDRTEGQSSQQGQRAGFADGLAIQEGSGRVIEKRIGAGQKGPQEMEIVSPMGAEDTGRWRSASEPVRKASGKEQLDKEVNPVLLRFISGAHLFDGSIANPPEEPKSLAKQPMSPTLLKQTSLTKLQLSPSFKPKVLERSLSSNLSLKKPIKLMPKPAPLPDAISPAQLARSESDSPAFALAAQPSPFLPQAQQPTRQDSSGSEAFSIGGQSLGSSDSGGLRSMGSLNVFCSTDESSSGVMHSEYSLNEGPSGYGGEGRGGTNLSSSGKRKVVHRKDRPFGRAGDDFGDFLALFLHCAGNWCTVL